MSNLSTTAMNTPNPDTLTPSELEFWAKESCWIRKDEQGFFRIQDRLVAGSSYKYEKFRKEFTQDEVVQMLHKHRGSVAAEFARYGCD